MRGTIETQAVMESALNSDQRAIRHLIATWLQASADGDVDKVLSLMSPDVIFLVAGQAPMHGRDAFAASLRSLLQTQRIVSSGEVEEVAVAGDIAYCRTRLTVTVQARDGSGAVHRAGNTLSILRKGGDGRWLLTRDANLLGAPS